MTALSLSFFENYLMFLEEQSQMRPKKKHESPIYDLFDLTSMHTL